jgi:hypothetical protein
MIVLMKLYWSLFYPWNLPYFFFFLEPPTIEIGVFKLWSKKADIKQTAQIKLIKKFTDEPIVCWMLIFINFRNIATRELLVGNLRTVVWNIFQSCLKYFPKCLISKNCNNEDHVTFKCKSIQKRNKTISSFHLEFFTCLILKIEENIYRT